MAMSEAHKKASAKYDAKAYEKKLVRFKPDQWEKFKAYTAENGYTDNGYIISAIMYCIENNINLKGE
ncbi:MAG: hypothetical protein NC235_06570 [Clostridiales bacterium]|nr:hypothetical protein [Clostridiales bacterium]